MRWLRFYTDAINDPKIAKLSDQLHRFWIGTLCIARRHELGFLPAVEEIAFHLRLSDRKAKANLQALIEARLIDETEGGLRPHDWDHWQPSSDSSTERMRRHRSRQRDGARDVTVTPPEKEGEEDKETDQNRPEQSPNNEQPSAKILSEGERELLRSRYSKEELIRIVGDPDPKVLSTKQLERLTDEHRVRCSTIQRGKAT